MTSFPSREAIYYFSFTLDVSNIFLPAVKENAHQLSIFHVIIPAVEMIHAIVSLYLAVSFERDRFIGLEP
jgi:hypothetical protein